MFSVIEQPTDNYKEILDIHFKKIATDFSKKFAIPKELFFNEYYDRNLMKYKIDILSSLERELIACSWKGIL